MRAARGFGGVAGAAVGTPRCSEGLLRTPLRGQQGDLGLCALADACIPGMDPPRWHPPFSEVFMVTEVAFTQSP